VDIVSIGARARARHFDRAPSCTSSRELAGGVWRLGGEHHIRNPQPPGLARPYPSVVVPIDGPVLDRIEFRQCGLCCHLPLTIDEPDRFTVCFVDD